MYCYSFEYRKTNTAWCLDDVFGLDFCNHWVLGLMAKYANLCLSSQQRLLQELNDLSTNFSQIKENRNVSSLIQKNL